MPQDITLQLAIIFSVLFVITMSVLFVMIYWKLFEKAGEEGWKCIIPLYNQYLIYELFWGNGWLFLLMMVPVASIVVGVMLMWKMAKSFERGIGTFLGLLLVPWIMLPILAFGSSKYLSPAGK